MTNYTDYKTDSKGNVIFENGDIVTVSGDEEIQQRARNNLSVHLKSWSFDESLGVDYQGIIFNREFTQADRINEIKRVLIETEGISNIISIVEKKGTDRQFMYEIECKTDNNGTIGVTA